MRKKLLKLTIFLLFICAFPTCKKSDWLDEFNNNQLFTREAILGKWKLVKSEHPMTRGVFYYSGYNIIYDFKENGILTVTGDLEIIHWMIGEHSYSFIEPPIILETLEIDDRPYWHRVTKNKLILDDSSSDGGISYFEKIK